MRMYRAIYKNTEGTNDNHNQVVFDFTDEKLFVHYFIIWADGVHDKYIVEGFRQFLTGQSYIRHFHMLPNSAEKVILGMLDTGNLPTIIR